MKTEFAVKAKPAKISRRLTVEQAFHEIAANCLGQIQANRSGMCERRDPESLHQMRVGLRRLDSALDMFSDFFRLPENLQTELDWLSKHLAAARDWDVLQKSTLRRLADVIGEKERCLSEIEAATAEEFNKKYNAAVKAVDSKRYQQLMQKLNDCLQNRDGRMSFTTRKGKQSVARIPGFAHVLLSRAQYRLLKLGEKLHDAPPKERHKVRIAAKKARYAAEFFDALMAKKTAKRYVKSLASLQDRLGHLNDLSVAGSLLTELASRRPDIAESIHFLRGYLAAYTESEARKIKTAWKTFKKSNLPHQWRSTASSK